MACVVFHWIVFFFFLDVFFRFSSFHLFFLFSGGEYSLFCSRDTLIVWGNGASIMSVFAILFKFHLFFFFFYSVYFYALGGGMGGKWIPYE